MTHRILNIKTSFGMSPLRIAKTAVIFNDLNPKWNEVFKIHVCHRADSIVFDVRDKDHAYTEVVGIVELPTQHLITGNVVEGWFPICKASKVILE